MGETQGTQQLSARWISRREYLERLAVGVENDGQF